MRKVFSGSVIKNPVYALEFHLLQVEDSVAVLGLGDFLAEVGKELLRFLILGVGFVGFGDVWDILFVLSEAVEVGIEGQVLGLGIDTLDGEFDGLFYVHVRSLYPYL
jgi:hypothetical protein